MKTILGFNSEQITSSGYSSEGFGGSCNTINNIDILFSGTETEVKEFVKTNKANLIKCDKISNELDNLIDYDYHDMSDEEYSRKYEDLSEKLIKYSLFERYDKLLIVEGEIITI